MADKETTNPENVSPIPAPAAPFTPTSEPSTTTTETTSVTTTMSETSTVPAVEEKKEEAVDLDEEDIEEYTKDKSFKSLLIAVPKRILELIIKIIGGKGAVLAVGTYLFFTSDKIPLWAWLVLVFVFIGGRYADKLIDRLVPGGTF